MKDDEKGQILDFEQFSKKLAEIIVLGLTTYVATLRLLNEVIEKDNLDSTLKKDTLKMAGRNLGIETLAYVQIFKHAGNHQELLSSPHNPSPIIPLAQELGISYSMLYRVNDQQSAKESPVTPIPVIISLYDQSAKDWLLKYVSVLPEYTEQEDDQKQN